MRANTLWNYQSLFDIYADPAFAPDARRTKLTKPLGELLSCFRDE